LAEKEIPPEKKEGKGSGCTRLLQAGFVVLGFIVVLQVLRATDDSFEGLTIRCCVGLIVIIILAVVFVFRGHRKRVSEWESEPQILEVSGGEVAYQQGEHLLSQGKREEAIAAYLQAYREGSPVVRKQALTALEALGEIEAF
jgi:hypothetical protein